MKSRSNAHLRVCARNCISCLLLLSSLNNKCLFILVSESGIQAQLSWVCLRPLWRWKPELGSYLKAQRGKDLFPSSLTWSLEVFNSIWAVDCGPQYLYGCWLEDILTSLPCGAPPSKTETCIITANKGVKPLGRWKLHSLVI